MTIFRICLTSLPSSIFSPNPLSPPLFPLSFSFSFSLFSPLPYFPSTSSPSFFLFPPPPSLPTSPVYPPSLFLLFLLSYQKLSASEKRGARSSFKLSRKIPFIKKREASPADGSDEPKGEGTSPYSI